MEGAERAVFAPKGCELRPDGAFEYDGTATEITGEGDAGRAPLLRGFLERQFAPQPVPDFRGQLSPHQWYGVRTRGLHAASLHGRGS